MIHPRHAGCMRKITIAATLLAVVALASCASSDSTAEQATTTTPPPPACADLRPGTDVPDTLNGCTLADGTTAPTDGMTCPDGRVVYAIPSSPQSIGVTGGKFVPGVDGTAMMQALCDA